MLVSARMFQIRDQSVPFYRELGCIQHSLKVCSQYSDLQGDRLEEYDQTCRPLKSQSYLPAATCPMISEAVKMHLACLHRDGYKPVYLLNRRTTAYVIRPNVCWCDRGVVVCGDPPGGAEITAVIKSVQKQTKQF